MAAMTVPQPPTLDAVEVERRILRAILTAAVVSDPDGKFIAPVKAWWPETFDPQDYPPEARKRLFDPSREDLDRYLDDLRWLNALTRAEARVVIACAHRKSFRQMADAWGYSHEYWRGRYKDLIKLIWAIANGFHGG